MNPLVNGLFKSFREKEELSEVSEDDAFELFAGSLILPPNLLAQLEASDLLLDAGTVGIDIAMIEINGQHVCDPTDVDEFCSGVANIDVTVHFVQAKRSSSISSMDILGFGDAIKGFLENRGFPGYPRIEAMAQAFRHIFDNYAPSLRRSPSVIASFVTTAPSAALDDATVRQRSTSTEALVTELGFLGKVEVAVLGADDLHEAWTRRNKANEVEIQFYKQLNLPKMAGIDQAILGVIPVTELLRLIESDDSSLNEKVFYDNVRGFKGSDNPVNQKILSTLSTEERNLLPVLNNGVTVVAGSYAPLPGDAVSISSYQIVNGCQTSHCLHLARDQIGDLGSSVYVPIRLVVTGDEEVATKIIRATNSQTEVQENDLVALTKFQRMLEDYYRLDDQEVRLSYERRSGQFYGKDVTKTRIVTINDQMRVLSAVFLDNPHAAARYANRLYDNVGESIFHEDHKLMPYIASSFAAYRLESAFRAGLETTYKPARYHILTAYKYQVLGQRSADLRSRRSEDQSRALISALKKADHVAQFRRAAEKVLEVAGGQMPTSDRLKRQQFTQTLIDLLSRDIE